MFRKILLAGCDVAKCFRCPFEDADHRIFSEEEQKKSVRIMFIAILEDNKLNISRETIPGDSIDDFSL